jgi:deoxyadenosine/deoxycytidine kinase
MPKRIEICAPLGAGKTTLVQALAPYGYTPIYERGDNPYLADFYQDISPETAFLKDKWFLDSKREALQPQLDGHDTAVFLLDYSSVSDGAYLEVGGHTDANKQVLHALLNDSENLYGAPDILLVLQVPLEEQITRIAARGRPEEASIPTTYLEALRSNIEKRLEQVPDSTHILDIEYTFDARNPFVAAQIAHRIERALNPQNLSALSHAALAR